MQLDLKDTIDAITFFQDIFYWEMYFVDQYLGTNHDGIINLTHDLLGDKSINQYCTKYMKCIFPIVYFS